MLILLSIDQQTFHVPCHMDSLHVDSVTNSSFAFLLSKIDVCFKIKKKPRYSLFTITVHFFSQEWEYPWCYSYQNEVGILRDFWPTFASSLLCHDVEANREPLFRPVTLTEKERRRFPLISSFERFLMNRQKQMHFVMARCVQTANQAERPLWG